MGNLKSSTDKAGSKAAAKPPKTPSPKKAAKE